MMLSKEDAMVCAKAFHDYFSNFDRIDEYMRDQKLNSLSEIPQGIFPIEDDLFSDFSMHPNDMDLEDDEEEEDDKVEELEEDIQMLEL